MLNNVAITTMRGAVSTTLMKVNATRMAITPDAARLKRTCSQSIARISSITS
jgi:hypothetical protein